MNNKNRAAKAQIVLIKRKKAKIIYERHKGNLDKNMSDDELVAYFSQMTTDNDVVDMIVELVEADWFGDEEDEIDEEESEESEFFEEDSH